MKNICHGHNGEVRIPCDDCKMTISKIEKDFEKEFGDFTVPDLYWYGRGLSRKGFDDRKIKQFYRSKFTELLESLRMEEFDGENNPMLNEFTRGKNQAIQEINKRISNLLK